ncbi:hypothetical protein BaRGS_00038883 [Batillaria attramentaria]|uniref:Uncharacterized protein n=1 Tax=Batillaria attramentaria TaxID=370345 RepID=A0ABD0J4V9_9CAEN
MATPLGNQGNTTTEYTFALTLVSTEWPEACILNRPRSSPIRAVLRCVCVCCSCNAPTLMVCIREQIRFWTSKMNAWHILPILVILSQGKLMLSQKAVSGCCTFSHTVSEIKNLQQVVKRVRRTGIL